MCRHHVEAFDGPAVSAEAAIGQAVALAFRSVDRGRLDRCEGLGVSMPAQMARDGFVRVAPLMGWEKSTCPAGPPRPAGAGAGDGRERRQRLRIGATYGRSRRARG